MFEESMRSYGWGYVGTGKRGFEWLFTPDQKDPAYQEDPNTGRCYPCCGCRSGDVFPNEVAAVKDGRKWMKKAGRSGDITAVKAETEHFEY